MCLDRSVDFFSDFLCLITQLRFWSIFCQILFLEGLAFAYEDGGCYHGDNFSAFPWGGDDLWFNGSTDLHSWGCFGDVLNSVKFKNSCNGNNSYC